MSETPEYRQRLEDIRARLRQSALEASRKWPEPTPEQKRAGCVEIVWSDQSAQAQASERRLDEIIISYAFGEADEASVRLVWADFVRVRMRRWKGGTPLPFIGEPDF